MSNKVTKAVKEQREADFLLALKVLRVSQPPGHRFTQTEIAAVTGMSQARIWYIESRALHKLRKKLHLRNDALLQTLGDAIGLKPTT